MGYLCADFSLHRPLCSRVTPDVRDRRQTDVQKHRLMPPPYEDGGIISVGKTVADKNAERHRVIYRTSLGPLSMHAASLFSPRWLRDVSERRR